ncbi:MAG: class I SAM-dependent methyltransferase [Anaerovoracaceae bacterium]|jgi:ubiquinone/menaquinone biosynthesis C-methylase UbiE
MTEKETNDGSRPSDINGNPGRPTGQDGVRMLERMNRSHAPIRAFGFSHLTWEPGLRILDVGCGGGQTIAEMLELAPESKITGVDYSEVSVRSTLEHNSRALGKRLDVVRGDVQDLPFEGDQFDLVTGVETVYFWPDVRKGVREILRVLKPGGRIALMNETDDPDPEGWPDFPGFFRIYTAGELRQILSEEGFREVETFQSGEGFLFATGIK